MLRINRKIIEDILFQGRESLPNEACGYLAGLGNEIMDRIPMTNADKSPEHFTFYPKEQFQALNYSRKKGLKLISVYHTHPKTPARPSEEDIKLAYDPGINYLIVSLLNNEVKCFKIVRGNVLKEDIEIFD